MKKLLQKLGIVIFLGLLLVSGINPDKVDAQTADQACQGASVGEDCSFSGGSGRCDRVSGGGLTCSTVEDSWANCDGNSRQGDACRNRGNIGSCQLSGQSYTCVPIGSLNNRRTGDDVDLNQAPADTSQNTNTNPSTPTTTNPNTGQPSNNPTVGAPSDGVVQGRSLVQCGGQGQQECTVCHIFILFRDIFNFSLQILASLAVLSVFIGGVFMLISGSNPSMFSQGVQIIQYAIIGIIITGASFVILNTILVILGFQSASVAGALTIQDGFFAVECDTANYFQDRGPEEREIGDNTANNGEAGSQTTSGPGSANVAVGSENIACIANDSISDEISATMRAITYFEGSSDGGGYYRLVGGDQYDGVTTHPGVENTNLFAETCCNSNAFGRYQMISTTWNAWAARAGVPLAKQGTNSLGEPFYDISPAYQDAAVAQTLTDNGINSCESFMSSSYRCQWASIEGCEQENDKTRATDFITLCNQLLEDEKNGTC